MACVRKQRDLDACCLYQKCLHFGATRFFTLKTTFLWGTFTVYHIIR
jgi:hypothetical protein